MKFIYMFFVALLLLAYTDASPHGVLVKQSAEETVSQVLREADISHHMEIPDVFTLIDEEKKHMDERKRRRKRSAPNAGKVLRSSSAVRLRQERSEMWDAVECLKNEHCGSGCFCGDGRCFPALTFNPRPVFFQFPGPGDLYGTTSTTHRPVC